MRDLLAVDETCAAGSEEQPEHHEWLSRDGREAFTERLRFNEIEHMQSPESEECGEDCIALARKIPIAAKAATAR